MLAKLIIKINKVRKFIEDNKLFHHLVLLTDNDALNAYRDEITESDYNKWKKIVSENIIFFKNVIKDEKFFQYWNNLNKDEKWSIILHDKEIYATLREKVKREDLCFVSPIDYVLNNNTPKKFLECIGTEVNNLPLTNEELDLFKNDLIKSYPEEKETINNWSLNNYRYNLFKIIEKYYAQLDNYEMEKVMSENFLISGYTLFWIRFQNNLENDLVNPLK